MNIYPVYICTLLEIDMHIPLRALTTRGHASLDSYKVLLFLETRILEHIPVAV